MSARPTGSARPAESGTRSSRDLFRGPFGRVMLANFALFLNFASFLLLPLFVRDLGGSDATVGVVMGAGGLATLLSLGLVGPRIDRLAPTPFFRAGAVTLTVAAVGYLAVDRIGPLLFLLRVLQGIGFAAGFTAAATLAAQLSPPLQRAQALGLFGISTLLTHAVAPSLGEEILRRAGFATLFGWTAICSLAALLLSAGLPTATGPADGSGGASSLPRAHRFLAIVMMLYGLGFGAVITYVPGFVYDADLGRASWFFASYTASGIAIRLVAGNLADRLGRQRVVIPALMAFGTAILLVSQVYSPFALVGAGLLFGAAQGVSYPTLHAFAVDSCPRDALGRAQALFNGSFNLGVMSSAFLLGYVADRLGQRPMFLLAATAPFLAALLFPVLVAPRVAARTRPAD